MKEKRETKKKENGSDDHLPDKFRRPFPWDSKPAAEGRRKTLRQ
jgi:hypothetical protein